MRLRASEDLAARVRRPDQPGASDSPAGSDSVLDEEDWQFSEEIRVEGDDLSDEPEAESGRTTSSTVSRFRRWLRRIGAGNRIVGSRSAARHRRRAGDRGDGGGRRGRSSSIESSSSWATFRRSSRCATNRASARSTTFPSLMEDEETSVASDLAAARLPGARDGGAARFAVGTYAAAGSTDDLGDPESWDLVGHDDFGRVWGRSVQDVSRSFSSATGIESVEAGDFFSDDALGGSGYDEELSGSSIMAGPVGHVVRFLGWGVTLALVGGIVFLALGNEWARWAQAPSRPRRIARSGDDLLGLGRDESLGVGAATSPGMIRNVGAEPIWPARVQLALLDGSGARLQPLRRSQAGMPLPETVLREAPLAALEERRAWRRSAWPPRLSLRVNAGIRGSAARRAPARVRPAGAPRGGATGLPRAQPGGGCRVRRPSGARDARCDGSLAAGLSRSGSDDGQPGCPAGCGRRPDRSRDGVRDGANRTFRPDPPSLCPG